MKTYEAKQFIAGLGILAGSIVTEEEIAGLDLNFHLKCGSLIEIGEPEAPKAETKPEGSEQSPTAGGSQVATGDETPEDLIGKSFQELGEILEGLRVADIPRSTKGRVLAIVAARAAQAETQSEGSETS